MQSQVLGYADYRNFEAVVEKARTACFNGGQRVDDHFVGIDDMVGIGKRGQRPVKTVMMSRYACYLVIQNADPAQGNRRARADVVAGIPLAHALRRRRPRRGSPATPLPARA